MNPFRCLPTLGSIVVRRLSLGMAQAAPGGQGLRDVVMLRAGAVVAVRNRVIEAKSDAASDI